MAIELKNVVVFVTDIARAREFYAGLLGLPLQQETPAVLEFFAAGTRFGVAAALHDDARRLVGRHTGITLRADDLDGLCARLAAAGVRFPEPPERSPWGTMAVVADPDGNQIALVDR